MNRKPLDWLVALCAILLLALLAVRFVRTLDAGSSNVLKAAASRVEALAGRIERSLDDRDGDTVQLPVEPLPPTPAAPRVVADWRAPALPPGSQAAQEIEPLERLRDPEMDYPRESRMAFSEGATRIGYMIASDGKVTDCVVITSSRDPMLDAASCALVRARARFRPARDANGRPLPSGREQSIVWKLGWDDLRVPRESFVRLRYLLYVDGAVDNCWLDRGPGTIAIPHPEMCRGKVPPPMLSLFQRAAGPVKMQVMSLGGHAFDEATMAAQMAERPGWQRALGYATWYDLDDQGVESNCRAQPFPGETVFEDDNPCALKPPRFDKPAERDGKPIAVRYGSNQAYYVRPAE